MRGLEEPSVEQVVLREDGLFPGQGEGELVLALELEIHDEDGERARDRRKGRIRRRGSRLPRRGVTLRAVDVAAQVIHAPDAAHIDQLYVVLFQHAVVGFEIAVDQVHAGRDKPNAGRIPCM